MNVGKLMSRDVKSCLPTQTVAKAAQIMWECDCGCVPVVDEDNCVIGMITDRDICMAAYFEGKPLYEISVADSMSPRVISCQKEDSVETAEKAMQEAQVRRLPITDAAGRLVGVLSLNDIAIGATRRPSSAEVGLEGVGFTLGAVCKPRRATVAS